MSDQSNRELSSINSDAEEDSLTLGGPTAQQEGTAYQFVSDIGRQVASETGSAAGATGQVAQEPQNTEQSPSAGKDPELYYERQSPD